MEIVYNEKTSGTVYIPDELLCGDGCEEDQKVVNFHLTLAKTH